MNILQTLKDFCTDQGELQYLCKEFDCEENTVVYTEKEAEELALEDRDFKDFKESINQEKIEIDA